MKTGQKIQELRIRAGLTQEQLAEKLFVSRELVSKWELGQRRPNIGLLKELAGLFCVEIDELIDAEMFSRELSACVPPGVQPDAARMKKILSVFLDTLSERDRTVFVRRYFFLDDIAEIADMFGIKENFVRTILARTRKKLKKYIKDEVRE
ncbi:MAG: helix-turn-helix domain-containing protein [Clostridia bacterium]|nr:helix-turn-helix domain-containing protein [Clostridia bacterium]